MSGLPSSFSPRAGLPAGKRHRSDQTTRPTKAKIAEQVIVAAKVHAAMVPHEERDISVSTVKVQVVATFHRSDGNAVDRTLTIKPNTAESVIESRISGFIHSKPPKAHTISKAEAQAL